MKIITINIDLAKSVFQVHGIGEHGKTALREKQFRRMLTSPSGCGSIAS